MGSNPQRAAFAQALEDQLRSVQRRLTVIEEARSGLADETIASNMQPSARPRHR